MSGHPKNGSTGYLRSHTRAANKPAESPLDRLANAVIDTMAVRDADQGQAFRDAQAVAVQPAGTRA
jgi:hypothetical protein